MGGEKSNKKCGFLKRFYNLTNQRTNQPTNQKSNQTTEYY